MPPRDNQQPQADRLLRFAQAINILRSDGTINRADARAWLNREYPSAQLTLEEDLAPAPHHPDEEFRDLAEVPDGGLSEIDPDRPHDDEEYAR